MRLISHRGNIEGSNPDLENTTPYIESAINSGFDVMIDLWLFDGKIYTGSDEPKNKLDIDWLEKYNNRLWFNCRDQVILTNLLSLDPLGKHLHYLHFSEGPMSLTSRNYLITKEEFSTPVAIVYQPDVNNKLTDVYGVCSDYVKSYI